MIYKSPAFLLYRNLFFEKILLVFVNPRFSGTPFFSCLIQTRNPEANGSHDGDGINDAPAPTQADIGNVN